jgi:hypothetical protein
VNTGKGPSEAAEGVATGTRIDDKISRLPFRPLSRMRASGYYVWQRNNQKYLQEDLMKPDGHDAGLVDRISTACRRWSRTIATTLALLMAPIAGHPASAATAGSDTHVYLLRGVLNIFSLGLDDIAAKLQQQGINATVANYLSWESLADEAAAEYRSGRVRTIVLVGHSSGATVLPNMAARLDQLGAPVKLAIGLDSVFQTSVAGHVGRYLNFYVANGAGTQVGKTSQFHGELENVEVGRMGVGHLTIDKDLAMQQKVINAIDAVAFSPTRALPVTQKRTGPGAATQRSAAGPAVAE